ncbi:glycoside hydrolase family 5 protein [Parvularcula sp. ZS-1/3]|uniref:Glycoside hydrolase family 5 protein n=1 Tax=Parvularcula mediterranea TaxID=2732508 RepID=A0A7Y3RN23_9PROT|nr:glycoside hydrolase family 5 protein [Parvularcula mediterranea]NNU16287.1 glycoside hydrolase family 5 protein [Parvularcula mediterranea]
MKALAAALLASIPAVAGAQEIAAAYDAKRCVNLGNDLERPKGASWGARAHTVADLEKIKSAGFDTVRIPVRWDDYAADEEPFTIDPAFFERVDALVEPALAMDLNVILNIHHFDEVMEEPRDYARKFLGLWRQIATHYNDAPDSLWYETLNEPRDALEGELMRAYQDVAVKGIREIDPERIIILMGDNWSSIRSLETNMDAPDENIVFSFHYYDPFEFTHQGAEWLGENMPKGKRGWGNTDERQALKRDADTAAAFAEATGHRVFLGEIGVNSAAKNRERVKYMGAVAEEMEKRDIAWCIWAYTNTFSLHTDDKGWDKAALKALGLNAP